TFKDDRPIDNQDVLIQVSDGTRTPPDLEDRAAKYLPDQNLLMINGDFRVFTDMVERWEQRYNHAPGAKTVIIQVTREWFESESPVLMLQSRIR
ncbi:MAG: hypothetical protein HY717_19035, partial [Planctomycetes bacterium]|nr:hypothetical protein [Planctomycetota bacterium]